MNTILTQDNLLMCSGLNKKNPTIKENKIVVSNAGKNSPKSF